VLKLQLALGPTTLKQRKMLLPSSSTETTPAKHATLLLLIATDIDVDVDSDSDSDTAADSFICSLIRQTSKQKQPTLKAAKGKEIGKQKD
jgi:hypothetical protein